MITRINHIAIAVDNLYDAIKIYTDILDMKVEEIIENPDARIAMIPVGQSKIELIESLDPSRNVAKSRSKQRDSLHHLALEVSNIQEALVTLTNKTIALVDEKPRKGVQNTQIAFLQPSATRGVLIELVEKPIQ